MTLVLADRVQETTNTTGTGTLTLAGAVAGYQSFSVIGNANATYYAIVSGSDWEVGIGTYTTTGTTLSRDTVLSSSEAGAKITVAAGASVFATYPASIAAPQKVTGYSTTVTAAGITALTSLSSFQQFFTGTSTHTVTLPSTSTLSLGWGYRITNNSTGNITVNTSGGSLVCIVPPQTTFMTTVVNVTTNAASSWGSGVIQVGSLLGGTGGSPLIQQWCISSALTLTGALQNVFGANSAASLDAGSTYEIECYCYFFKNTAGTVQWIPTWSNAVTVAHSILDYTPVTGFNTTLISGAMVSAEGTQRTTTTITHAATASLTTAVSHIASLRIRCTTNLACNFRLANTIGTGSITMQPGSYYTVRKISGNAGIFVA